MMSKNIQFVFFICVAIAIQAHSQVRLANPGISEQETTVLQGNFHGNKQVMLIKKSPVGTGEQGQISLKISSLVDDVFRETVLDGATLEVLAHYELDSEEGKVKKATKIDQRDFLAVLAFRLRGFPFGAGQSLTID